MSKILIAAFDHYHQADQAKQALISQGIDNRAMQLSGDGGGARMSAR